MPIFEIVCRECNTVVEKIQRADAPVENCEACGNPRYKAISSFGIVNTGLISRYNDKTKDYANLPGTWQMETDPKTGKRNVPVWIETLQEQREFCKRENLHNPGDLGPIIGVEKNDVVPVAAIRRLPFIFPTDMA